MVGMNAPTMIMFEIAQGVVDDYGRTEWDADDIKEWFEWLSNDILTGEEELDDDKLFEDWQTLVETPGIKELIDWNMIATSLDFVVDE